MMQRGPPPYAAAAGGGASTVQPTPVGAGGAAGGGRTINNPQQMLELYDVMRAEIEALVKENQNYRALRDEYQRKVEEQVSEMQAFEQNLMDLDHKHKRMKDGYEAEIRRLKGSTNNAVTAAVPTPAPPPGTSASLPPYLPGVLGPPPPSISRNVGGVGTVGAVGGVGGVGTVGNVVVPPPPIPGPPVQAQPPQQPGENVGVPAQTSTQPHQLGISQLVPTVTGPPPPPSGARPGSMKKEAQEDDYVVLQGRDPAGNAVNMKVGLQNSLQHDSVVCCVRYSWDGNYLATGSNRSAQIYEVNTGATLASFAKEDVSTLENGEKADSYVRAVCFSPDGQWLVTGAEDHVVKVWDVRRRTVKHQLVGHDTDIYSVDVSANSLFIVSGSGDKKAKLWNLDSGKLLATLGEEYGPTDGITSVCVSPTSQLVAAGSLDKIVRVWDVESNRLVRQLEGHRDSVYSVAFSPDGRMLLSGSLDKTLKLWDLTAQNPSSQCRLSFAGHKDFVLSVAFCPHSRFVISGSKDRTVQFWDPRHSTMALQLQGHRNSVISIAHNPLTQSLATGSGDCRARTWTYN